MAVKRVNLMSVMACALLLAGLPLLVIGRHWQTELKSPRFVVSSEIITQPRYENMHLISEINTLNVDDLAGTDNIKTGDKVYVHMAYGPDKIAYPFSVTHDQPKKKTDQHSFTINGTVTEYDGQIMRVRYNFETFLPSPVLSEILSGKDNVTARVELVVNDQSLARLVAIHFHGQTYPYRVINTPKIDLLPDRS